MTKTGVSTESHTTAAPSVYHDWNCGRKRRGRLPSSTKAKLAQDRARQGRAGQDEETHGASLRKWRSTCRRVWVGAGGELEIRSGGLIVSRHDACGEFPAGVDAGIKVKVRGMPSRDGLGGRIAVWVGAGLVAWWWRWK